MYRTADLPKGCDIQTANGETRFFIILIFKTSSRPKLEKQNCLLSTIATPKHLRHGKLRKAQLGEATND